MKVAILVECGRQGLEDVVCRRICELLQDRTGVQFQHNIVPMDNKKTLIQDCGTVTALLFDEGNDRVVILWDERPAWPVHGEPLCWHNDREAILANLKAAHVPDRKVHLVCIEREFESWLLHDERMLALVFSTKTRTPRVNPPNNPHQLSNPKGAMTALFRKHRGWPYVDVQHAPYFAKHLNDLARLLKCQTFRRFAEKVTGQAI